MRIFHTYPFLLLLLLVIVGLLLTCREEYNNNNKTLQSSMWTLTKKEVTEEDNLAFTTVVTLRFRSKDVVEYNIRVFMTNNPKMIADNQTVKLRYKYDAKTRKGTISPDTKFYIDKSDRLVLTSDDTQEKLVFTRK